MLTWGDPAAPEAVPAARLDGRRRVVPVSGRCARSATGTRSRPICAASAAAPGSRRATGFPITSPISRRCSSRFAPGEAVDLVGHSLGGNIVMHYAGVRPAARARGRVARRLRHSRRESRSRAEEDTRRGSTRSPHPESFKPYANLDAVADRLQKTNPRLAARQGALFLAAHWAEVAAGRPRAAHVRSAPQAAVPDGVPDGGGLRDLARDHGAGAVGRRRGFAHSALAERCIPEGEAGADDLAGDAPPHRARAAAARSSTIADAGPHAAPRSAGGGRRGDRTVPRRVTRRRGAAHARAHAAARRLRRARRRAHADLGQQLARDEARARARRSGHLQHRSARWSRSPCCSALLSWQRRPLLPESVARGRSSPASSRRRSTSARRRWRSPAAAPAARRCWCSRCRSGRSCSPGRCCTSALRGVQWVAVGARVRRARRWSSSRGTGRATLAPKLWAVLSGFGWAAGTVAIKYFQREQQVRHAELHRLADGARASCRCALVPLVVRCPGDATGASPTWSLLLFTGAISTAIGFVLWIAVLRWLPAGTASLNMLAIPVIALMRRCCIFGERLTARRVDRHRLHRRRPRVVSLHRRGARAGSARGADAASGAAAIAPASLRGRPRSSAARSG